RVAGSGGTAGPGGADGGPGLVVCGRVVPGRVAGKRGCTERGSAGRGRVGSLGRDREGVGSGVADIRRVLIAADKLKGSLTAGGGARHVAAGLRRAAPDLEVRELPVADGGDGTVAAAVAAGYERRELPVTGPLGTPVAAGFALRGGTAVVEMAEASGL